MLQLLYLVKQISMCVIMLGPITGQEFVIIPSRRHEILVPPLRSEPTKHREFHKHASTKPHYTVLRSEGYEVFPTHESEHENYLRHSNVRFMTTRRPSSGPQKDKKIIVGTKYADQPLPPAFDHNGTYLKDDNKVFEVSDRPVLRDSIDSSDIMRNVSTINDIAVNSNTTLKNIKVTDDVEVSVDDRASFDGDQCPKGHVKVQGKCVPPD